MISYSNYSSFELTEICVNKNLVAVYKRRHEHESTVPRDRFHSEGRAPLSIVDRLTCVKSDSISHKRIRKPEGEGVASIVGLFARAHVVVQGDIISLYCFSNAVIVADATMVSFVGGVYRAITH